LTRKSSTQHVKIGHCKRVNLFHVVYWNDPVIEGVNLPAIFVFVACQDTFGTHAIERLVKSANAAKQINVGQHR
jgi:hypothetical protein